VILNSHRSVHEESNVPRLQLDSLYEKDTQPNSKCWRLWWQHGLHGFKWSVV